MSGEELWEGGGGVNLLMPGAKIATNSEADL